MCSYHQKFQKLMSNKLYFYYLSIRFKENRYCDNRKMPLTFIKLGPMFNDRMPMWFELCQKIILSVENFTCNIAAVCFCFGHRAAEFLIILKKKFNLFFSLKTIYNFSVFCNFLIVKCHSVIFIVLIYYNQILFT